MDDEVPFLNEGQPPEAGEGLVGYLVRHDALNGVPAGTIASLVSRHVVIGASALASPGLALLGTAFDLEELAAITDQRLVDIESLIFRRELRALFGKRVSARAIGRTKAFRICPACVRRRFIARESILPLVDVCDEHGLILASQCRCGRPLVPFGPLQTAFACALPCGKDWKDLPWLEPSREVLYTQRRIIRAYRWILTELPNDLVAAAAQIAALDDGPRYRGGSLARSHYPLDLGTPKYFASLSGVVGLLVRRNLPPIRLAQVLPLPREDAHACRNRTCLAPLESIRRNGSRDGVWETYCSECGSRFVGDRTVASFDVDNGDPRLGWRSVRRARRRLFVWRLRLHEATLTLMAERPSEEIRVKEVFALAKVPWAGYLHARRLRLVEVVKATLRGGPSAAVDAERMSPLQFRYRPGMPR